MCLPALFCPSVIHALFKQSWKSPRKVTWITAGFLCMLKLTARQREAAAFFYMESVQRFGVSAQSPNAFPEDLRTLRFPGLQN
jgi:hypothetical protein